MRTRHTFRLPPDLAGKLADYAARKGVPQALVVEAIADPLVHMVRNSADHGIESPDERERAGKPRQGRIFLRAERAGNSSGARIYTVTYRAVDDSGNATLASATVRVEHN